MKTLKIGDVVIIEWKDIEPQKHSEMPSLTGLIGVVEGISSSKSVLVRHGDSFWEEFFWHPPHSLK